jgi:hypothetical protein
MTHISDVQCPVTYGGVSVDNRCIIYADVTCDCMYIRVIMASDYNFVIFKHSIVICSWHAKIELTYAETVTQYIPNTEW